MHYFPAAALSWKCEGYPPYLINSGLHKFQTLKFSDKSFWDTSTAKIKHELRRSSWSKIKKFFAKAFWFCSSSVGSFCSQSMGFTRKTNLQNYLANIIWQIRFSNGIIFDLIKLIFFFQINIASGKMDHLPFDLISAVAEAESSFHNLPNHFALIS